MQEASSSGATRYQAITGSIPILEFLDKSKGRTGLTAVSQGAADGPSSNYGGSLPASAEVETRAVSNEGIVLTPATIGAKRESDEVIRVLQSADGNAILFGFLDKTERDFKQKLFQQAFVDRMEALVKYFEEAKEEGGPQAQSRISFYEKTLEKYAPLAASYNALPASFSTSQGQEGAFNQNTASNLVIQKIEAECEKLSEMFQKLEGMVKLPYALGDQFSIADVAAMAVLARFAFIAKLRRAASSGTSPQSDREPLTSFVGLPANVSVGPKIQTYTSHLMVSALDGYRNMS